MSSKRKMIILQRRFEAELAEKVAELETVKQALAAAEARAELAEKKVTETKTKPTPKKRTTRKPRAKKATDKE